MCLRVVILVDFRGELLGLLRNRLFHVLAALALTRERQALRLYLAHVEYIERIAHGNHRLILIGIEFRGLALHADRTGG